jgi:hypothetical protein
MDDIEKAIIIHRKFLRKFWSGYHFNGTWQGGCGIVTCSKTVIWHEAIMPLVPLAVDVDTIAHQTIIFKVLNLK